MGENDATRYHHPIQQTHIKGFPQSYLAQEARSAATKKLLDDVSMEGMTLRAPPSADLRI
jgi:hypothetical protein